MAKYEPRKNKDDKWDVRVINPQNRKGFRKLDENSLEDVPFRNIIDEDNARLAAAALTQFGNTRSGKWKE